MGEGAEAGGAVREIFETEEAHQRRRGGGGAVVVGFRRIAGIRRAESAWASAVVARACTRSWGRSGWQRQGVAVGNGGAGPIRRYRQRLVARW